MSKKNISILALQVVAIGVFVMIALGCGGSSPQQAYDAGYEIGHGVGTLINN